MKGLYFYFLFILSKAISIMKYQERKQKLDYLLEMIQKGRCLSLQHIADTLGVCTRTAKRMIAELREEGHSVMYSKTAKKFCIKEKN